VTTGNVPVVIFRQVSLQEAIDVQSAFFPK
jgi:hypothetical protein